VSTYLELGARCLLAGVLLASLGGKLRGRAAYSDFVTATGSLLSTSAQRAAVLAPATIAAEIGTVVALVVDPAGLLAAIALLGSFTAALVAATRRGSAASCHCFGATDTPVGAHHVARNIVLIAAAAVGWVAAATGAAEPLDPAALAVTVFGAAVCVLITARLDDLVDLLR